MLHIPFLGGLLTFLFFRTNFKEQAKHGKVAGLVGSSSSCGLKHGGMEMGLDVDGFVQGKGKPKVVLGSRFI